MLQFTPDCTALSLMVERLLAVTLHMWLSGHAVSHVIGCHHAKFASKLKYFNSSEFVAPQILVNALACARRKCGATNQSSRLVWTHSNVSWAIPPPHYRTEANRTELHPPVEMRHMTLTRHVFLLYFLFMSLFIDYDICVCSIVLSVVAVQRGHFVVLFSSYWQRK